MYHALRNERRALIQQLRGIKTVNGIRLCNMTSTEGRAFLTCFNTASGIRPCNKVYGFFIAPRGFQYRKRYSPVQPDNTYEPC